jgi:hypothetical protein
MLSSERCAHLDVSCAPIQIEVQIFYLPKFGELVSNVLFCGLLVDVCYEYYPTLDS